MSLGDLLENSDKSNLFGQSLNTGEVFLKKFEGIDHPKFFIIAGISKDRISVCSVYINSHIHPSIMQKQKLLDLQILLKKQNNSFLKYDSYVNCSDYISMKLNAISNWIADRSCKVIGSINDEELKSIRETLINSGLLTGEQIEEFFSD